MLLYYQLDWIEIIDCLPRGYFLGYYKHPLDALKSQLFPAKQADQFINLMLKSLEKRKRKKSRGKTVWSIGFLSFSLGYPKFMTFFHKNRKNGEPSKIG